jgi:hypothetical protein
MKNLSFELQRMIDMMKLHEQDVPNNLFDDIINGDLSKVKEFLLSNQEFTTKLQNFFKVSNSEELQKKLAFPNKTEIMKIMQKMNDSKDSEGYKFLDSILKNQK